MIESLKDKTEDSPLVLRYLVRLMDDESPKVKSHVTNELKKYGLELRKKIKEQPLKLTASQERVLTGIEHDFVASKIKSGWKNIFTDLHEWDRLEAVFGAISEYQNNFHRSEGHAFLLDDLARGFKTFSPENEPLALSEYLFQQVAFSGNTGDFYNPYNSNLGYVLEEKLGIPITLSCLFMLVGKRLGIPIYGCNIPGHFLTRVQLGNETYFIDCFNEGKVISELDMPNIKLFQFEKYKSLFYNPAPMNVIITRLLRNLVHAYRLNNLSVQESFFKLLLNLTLKARFRETPNLI